MIQIDSYSIFFISANFGDLLLSFLCIIKMKIWENVKGDIQAYQQFDTFFRIMNDQSVEIVLLLPGRGWNW